MMRTHPLFGAALTFVVLGGCADGATPQEPLAGDQAAGLYWALTLDHDAAVLSTASPYDTLRITATPRDGTGRPLGGLGLVTYHSDNPQQIAVDSTGLVRALGVGEGLAVVAELAAGGTVHSDTLFVTITNDPAPPAFADLSIRPSAPDSTKWAVNGDGSMLFIQPTGDSFSLPFKVVSPFGTDVNGQLIPGVPATYASSDPKVALVDGVNGGTLMVLFPKKPGRTMVTASTTAYGVKLADTVEFTITMPVVTVVKIQRRQGSGEITFSPREVVVSPGGTVIWVNTTGEPVDIAFDNAGAVGAHGLPSCAAGGVVDPGGTGDVPAFGEPLAPNAPLSAANCRSRGFAVPGVYPYRSALTGATGRVVVDNGVDGI